MRRFGYMVSTVIYSPRPPIFLYHYRSNGKAPSCQLRLTTSLFSMTTQHAKSHVCFNTNMNSFRSISSTITITCIIVCILGRFIWSYKRFMDLSLHTHTCQVNERRFLKRQRPQISAFKQVVFCQKKSALIVMSCVMAGISILRYLGFRVKFNIESPWSNLSLHFHK